MKAKPKGPKSRNLTARGGVIYYQRRWAGRRYVLSTKTDDWQQAAAIRDAFEAKLGIGCAAFLAAPEVPTFDDFAQRYLDEATAHLAPSTREDRLGLLRAEKVREDGTVEQKAGPLRAYFGPFRVDQIGRRELLEWWQREIESAPVPQRKARGRTSTSPGLSRATGNNRLNALAGVLGYAMDLELIAANPVDALRSVLRRRGRTKAGRERAAVQHSRPIETGEELRALLEASASRSWLRPGQARAGDGVAEQFHLLTLVLLDAGLRLGEALALRWQDVNLGADAGDATRALMIRQSRARGKHLGTTKSGRERVVALSRRLRTAFLAQQMATGRPSGDRMVFPDLDPSHYRRRHFSRACAVAGLGSRSPKDLRDTFASQLLTAGIPLGYVSEQLGHSDVAVTARHYARWCGTQYRAPFALGAGDVPADLIARLSDECAPAQVVSR